MTIVQYGIMLPAWGLAQLIIAISTKVLFRGDVSNVITRTWIRLPSTVIQLVILPQIIIFHSVTPVSTAIPFLRHRLIPRQDLGTPTPVENYRALQLIFRLTRQNHSAH